MDDLINKNISILPESQHLKHLVSGKVFILGEKEKGREWERK